MIKAMVYNISLMLGAFKFIFYLIINIILLPFKLISSLFNNKSISNQKRKFVSKTSSFDKGANLYHLSNNEMKLAKEERMSPSEFVEAEERNDDNLDNDD